MALSPSFANHLAPGLRDIVGTSFKNWPSFYSKFFHVETSKRQYEDYLYATGLPIATERKEGEPTPFFDPIEGSTKRVIHKQWAMGFQVSKEVWDDDLYKAKSALRKAASGLARSMMERVEVEAADIYINGFSTHTTIDGLSLFNTAHTRLDGGATQSNRVTNALSLSSLRTAVVEARKWVDDRGIKIMGRLDKLIVPNDLEYTARELLNSPMGVGASFTSAAAPDRSTTRNVTAGIASLEVWPYLTDVNDWFMLGSSDHYVTFLWRERPMFTSYDDKNTRTAKFAAFMRFIPFAVHWHNTYGAIV